MIEKRFKKTCFFLNPPVVLLNSLPWIWIYFLGYTICLRNGRLWRDHTKGLKSSSFSDTNLPKTERWVAFQVLIILKCLFVLSGLHLTSDIPPFFEKHTRTQYKKLSQLIPIYKTSKQIQRLWSSFQAPIWRTKKRDGNLGEVVATSTADLTSNLFQQVFGELPNEVRMENIHHGWGSRWMDPIENGDFPASHISFQGKCSYIFPSNIDPKLFEAKVEMRMSAV